MTKPNEQKAKRLTGPTEAEVNVSFLAIERTFPNVSMVLRAHIRALDTLNAELAEACEGLLAAYSYVTEKLAGHNGCSASEYEDEFANDPQAVKARAAIAKARKK